MITLLFWISISAILVMIPTAIAARVLQEFSRHELEGYCRRQNRPERFDEILDSHEQFALGAEALQGFSLVTFLVPASLWFFSSEISGTETTAVFFIPAISALVLWITTITFLIVLINSWIPWAVVKLASAPFLYHTWGLWRFVSQLAWPFSIGYSGLTWVAQRMAGHEDDEDQEEEALEEEIRAIVTAGERDGLLESPAREMIEGVINLDDVDVGEIMTPRSKMNALDIELSATELIDKAIEFGHTRIPIYSGNMDNIIGILFVKDLLPYLNHPQANQNVDIRSLLRKPQFVPMSIQNDDLLQRFRASRSHLSVVVDEYHSVMGVVTIEDVLEEIVGEINDETDNEQEAEFLIVDRFTTKVLGTTNINDINDFLKIDLPTTDDFDTLAGLVLTRLGRIPKQGESINEGNVRIEVEEVTRRTIERLKLTILEENSVQG